MALETFTIVAYSGTNIGAIYLEDCGKRKQLGGGDQFVHGQDIVINHGDRIALVNGGPVLVSAQLGILKRYAASGSLVLTQSATATGIVRTGMGTKVDPLVTQGDF